MEKIKDRNGEVLQEDDVVKVLVIDSENRPLTFNLIVQNGSLVDPEGNDFTHMFKEDVNKDLLIVKRES